jgi:hypothetical protein
MNLVNALDSRSYLVRQDRKVPTHSKFFNERGWASSAIALENANKFKRTQAPVAAKVDRLKTLRFDAKVEAAKVVNRETPKATPVPGGYMVPSQDHRKVAKLAGLTVKALRALAKDAGLKGYSKARKADLVAMLS